MRRKYSLKWQSVLYLERRALPLWTMYDELVMRTRLKLLVDWREIEADGQIGDSCGFSGCAFI